MPSTIQQHQDEKLDDEIFFQETERLYHETHRVLSDMEIIEIFSDVDLVETIRNCLKYWGQQREEVVNSISNKLKLLKEKAKNEIDYYFWRTCIVHLWDGKELGEVDGHIARLKRMCWLIEKPDNRKSRYDFELRKEIALKRPIVEVVQPFITNLKPSGKNRYKSLCPFHSEKTPSFTIFADDSNHFYCFGCSKGGDTITFIRLIRNCSFKEAVDILTR